MKWLLEELMIYLYGYLNFFDEENFIYVYIASTLSSIAFIWNYYSINTAMTFTILLSLSVFSVIGVGIIKERVCEEKLGKAITILLDVFLTGLVIVGCIVNFKLAICVVCFNITLQLIMWLADRLDICAHANGKLFYKVIAFLLDIIVMMLPVVITILLGVFFWKLDIAIVVKIVVSIIYILAIPLITILSDEISMSISEIVSIGVPYV